MTDVHGKQDLARRDETLAAPSIRASRGLRITLLSLAAAILLTGAAVAGIFAYRTLSHGPADAWRLSVEHYGAPPGSRR